MPFRRCSCRPLRLDQRARPTPSHRLSPSSIQRPQPHQSKKTHQLKEGPMPERTVTIASAHGLHARPASLFVQAVTASGLAVELTKGEKTLNAASILGVISLGIEHGDQITLRADGDNADATLDSLVELLTTDFDA